MTLWSRAEAAFSALRSGAAVRAVGGMALASGFGQLAIFASLPLVSRLFPPSAFGQQSTVMSFVGIASVAACMSLELAIVSAGSDEDADVLFATALWSVPVTSTLAAMVLLLLIDTGAFGYDAFPWWTALVAGVMTGLNGIYVATRCRAVRQQQFGAIARTTLTQNVGRALAPLVLAVMTRSWAGLVGGELVGRALGVGNLLRAVGASGLLGRVWGLRRGWATVIRREYRYTVLLLTSTLVDAGASMMIAPLLAGTFGADAAGEYFLVSMIMVAPSALIGNAAADVIHARGARIFHAAPHQLLAFMVRAALALTGFALVIYGPVYLLAPRVLPLLLGPQWLGIAEAVRAMTPFIVVAFVASPCSRMLSVVNRPALKGWTDALRLVVTPIVIYDGFASGQTFHSTLEQACWFLAFAYFIYFAVTYAAVRLSVGALR